MKKKRKVKVVDHRKDHSSEPVTEKANEVLVSPELYKVSRKAELAWYKLKSEDLQAARNLQDTELRILRTDLEEERKRRVLAEAMLRHFLNLL